MTVALVTGANKGIGLAAARALAQQGMKVWIGARSEERGREAEAALRAENLDAEFVKLDVADPGSIAAAADHVSKSSGVLDVLVNNAGTQVEMKRGFGDPMRPSEISPEEIAEVFNTNTFGPITTIQAFLPLLRKSAAGRIVNVSSRLGSFGHLTGQDVPAFNLLAYSASKAALNMVTVSFAHELRDTNIKVNSICPGLIASDLSRSRTADELSRQPGFGKPEEGAQVIVKCATLPADGPTGKFFRGDGFHAW